MGPFAHLIRLIPRTACTPSVALMAHEPAHACVACSLLASGKISPIHLSFEVHQTQLRVASPQG